MRALLSALAAVSLLAACETGASAGACEASATPRESYPVAGTGATEGSVLADLELVRPDGQPLSFSEIHRDGANRLILITTAAGWCTACIKEQPALQELHDKYSNNGLFILVSIFEDGLFQAAQAANAEQWKRQFKLSFEVVADPEFKLGAYYNRDQTPMVMLVDACSMEILSLSTGWDPDLVESIVESRL
jgi:thiol-disulfide isomerase/thioredoxin